MSVIAIYTQEENFLQHLSAKPYQYFKDCKLINVNVDQGLPDMCSSLILSGDFENNIRIPNCLAQAVESDKKILGVGSGFKMLMEYFGQKIIRTSEFTGSNTSFLVLGSRFAEIIGGSGPIKLKFSREEEIEISSVPPKFLTTAINVKNGCAEAIEIARNNQIIGVIWPIFSSDDYPSGFENIFDWITDK